MELFYLPKDLYNEICFEIVEGDHAALIGSNGTGKSTLLKCLLNQNRIQKGSIRIDGKECVVIGRSNIVGKPIAQLLLAENGTVTIAHSRTVNLKEVTKRADILVVAIGKRQMIDAEYVKPGAAVIDVGIHRDEANRLCGDVDYESVFPVASAITPVPGGVGPMTIAMLMKNCIESRRRRL